MKKKKISRDRLKYWQEKFELAQADYADEKDRMNWREKLYNGTHEIKPAPGAKNGAKDARHVQNIVAEMIETQVSSAIPMPKVQAIRPQDELLATKIENFLRNEVERLPFEELNDQDERTTYIQGGDHFLVEWDTTKRTHSAQGMLEVNLQHPKTVTPQPGVLTGIEDMDYWFVEIPRTKEWIFENYGVDMEHETEEDPDLRGVDDAMTADDLVDQIYAFYRNRKTGNIGLFSWVNNTALDDDADYQARKQQCCAKCGAPGNGPVCAWCGSTEFSDEGNEGQQSGRVITETIRKSDGSVIAPLSPARNEYGEIEMETEIDPLTGSILRTPVMEQTVLPWYKPNVYPLVLRKNVSTFGKYLGGSDVDKIEDQQETIKKLKTKAVEKLLKGGSIVALPAGLPIRNTDEELKRVDVQNPADLQKIGIFNLQVDITGDLSMAAQCYEESRNTLGITDSFQGKRDSTATSGTAKQFAAAQSAGRLESKRVMKDAAYARLYEIMFKFALAYMDAPQEIAFTDGHGGRVHDVFNPFDFVEQDAAGEWYWNDQFLFGVDSSASLVTNREALWQETRMNYTQGCYGQPGTPEALYAFWRNMASYHYPGAADMMQIFEERLAQQQAAAQAQTTAQGAGGAPAGYDAAGAIAQMDEQQQTDQMLINGGGRQV